MFLPLFLPPARVQFNRSLRLKARKMGYSLNQRGLYANVIRDNQGEKATEGEPSSRTSYPSSLSRFATSGRGGARLPGGALPLKGGELLEANRCLRVGVLVASDSEREIFYILGTYTSQG